MLERLVAKTAAGFELGDIDVIGEEGDELMDFSKEVNEVISTMF